jgi:hypothetical protein
MPALQADVTLRYKTEVKLNPALPAAFAQQTTKGMAAAVPAETVLQLKDGKGYSSFGGYRSITDFQKQELTLIDAENRRFTTAPADRFLDEYAKTIAELPAEARAAIASMKVAAETRVTGRTASIQGIEAEEREVVLTIEGPALPNAPQGPMMRLVMQLWTARDSETLRVPAIRELKGYNLYAYATMNPAGSLEKILRQMPGMGEGLAKVREGIQAANAALLRSHTTMFMPGLAAMLKQMPPGQTPFGADFDADAPFLEINQELAELSTAAIPAAAFQLPEGYQEAPLSELVHGMMAKSKAAAKQ